MRVSTLAMAGVAAAAPTQNEKRQGACDVAWVWARGSTEPGGLGFIVGPKIETPLKRMFPSLKIQYVKYDASIATNISMDRTDAGSKAKGVAAFKAVENCRVIIAGGYSQGAAVMHNVLGTVNGKPSTLDAALRNKVVGVALFGDTRNQQDGGHIKGFPTENSKVWCNTSDGVCGGLLNVNIGHLSYTQTQGTEAANWLAARVKAFKGGNSGSSGSSSDDSPSPAPKAKGVPKAKGAAPPKASSPKPKGGDESASDAAPKDDAASSD